MKYNAYSSTAYNSTTSGIYANPRTITASIVVNGTTTYTQQNIKTFKIDSTPVNGKWFGISYSQQLSVTFIDPDKSITINRGDSIKVSLICNGCTVAYPTYYVDSSNRDEKTGDLTAVGFDIMAKANNLTFALGDNWTGGYVDLCNLCATALGTTCAVVGEPSSSIPSQIWTKDTVNIPADGYSLRDMITAIAEAGGRFAYINSQDKLIFRMVTNNASSEIDSTANFVNAPVKIDKTRYFELTTDKQCTLTGITHKNELNDTVSVGTSTGINQVIYDNPLISLLTDTEISALLSNILNHIYTHVTPFNISWRGNMACEIGDTVWTAEKECSTLADSWVYNSTPGVIWDCFYLSETVEYNGGVRGTIQWEYQPSENPAVGPTNIGTSNRTTRATVDKANGKIELLVAEIDGPTGIGSRLTITENNISTIVGDWGPTGTHTKIEQNAESISSIAQVIGPTGTFWSRIEQDAEGVAITATQQVMTEVIGPTGSWAGEIPLLGPSGTIPAMQDDITTLQVGATGITTSVSQIVTALGPTGTWPSGVGTDNLFGPSGIIYNLSSEINQTAGEINTLVQAVGPTGGKVYSKISQTASDITAEVYGPTGVASIFATANSSSGGSAIKLNADHIQMTGQTTFLTASDVGPSGSTVISGNRITTGTLNGGLLQANSVKASSIDTTNLKVQYVEPLNATDDQTYIHADDAGIEIYAHKISGGQYVNNLILQGDNLYLLAENKIVIDDTAYGSTLPVSNLSEGRIFFKLAN